MSCTSSTSPMIGLLISGNPDFNSDTEDDGQPGELDEILELLPDAVRDSARAYLQGMNSLYPARSVSTRGGTL